MTPPLPRSAVPPVTAAGLPALQRRTSAVLVVSQILGGLGVAIGIARLEALAATGGLGGVHREWADSQDESADLRLLARTGIMVVLRGCEVDPRRPGDAPAPGDPGVGIFGYGTGHFPGFYLSSSGQPVDWTVHSPEEVVEVVRAKEALGGPAAALIVANPVPEADQLDPALHDRVLSEALDACRERGITGQGVTPFLLDQLMRRTEGASLEANLAAVRGNVRLAARIAAAAAVR
ncbi:Pseudouridine-5'-phosphate glycosidase [Streptomyces microflavus]